MRQSSRSLSSCSFSGLLLLFAAGARAEAPSVASPFPASTWSQQAPTGVEQEVESPELRALRLAEEDLFSKSEPEDPREAKTPVDAVFEAPPDHIELNGKRVDLAFLKGLELPSLPVRWDRRVIEYLLFFKDDPRGRELAAGWIKRRERFGAMIRRVLDEHGLPADVQYVAMIESGYDPTARSQVDAWGMWQFMQQPGSSYGLRIDRWVDERLDPERSTRAASRFMRDLHDRFGSWELAFAAYNMGYGGLLRAIKKYNSNDYWLLSHLEAGLPFETSLYVSKIAAMAIVGHNPERFGFKELTMEAPRATAKVDVAPGTALDEIAAAAGITVEQLRTYNPHLKQSRTPPGDDVQVYVPREQQVQFTQHWAARKSNDAVLPYTVRLGEGLEDLAKRADTSVDKLRELNALAHDEKLKPGFTLFVPAHATPTRDLNEPMVATVPSRDFSYPDRKQVFYRAGVEDDASKVAQFFAVTPDELMSWNSLSPGASLQPGMLLQLFVAPEVDLQQAVVYEPKDVKILELGSDEFFAYHEAQRGRVRVRYRVQSGDTLTALGQRFDLSTGSLGRINQFASDRELRLGDTMILYVPKDDVPALTARGVIAPLHEDEPAPRVAQAEAPKPAPAEDGERTWGGQLMEPAKTKPVAPPVTWATESDGRDHPVALQRSRSLATSSLQPLRPVRPAVAPAVAPRTLQERAASSPKKPASPSSKSKK
ncbi:MAG TPA: LysM peptidoglycan-binding domain-containing protein [Polyangiales bacterium]|nr:LysM peptidoglycan-binding domain-containing protein [Polyangiales bacterium]